MIRKPGACGARILHRIAACLAAGVFGFCLFAGDAALVPPEEAGLSARILETAVDVVAEAVVRDEIRGAVVLAARRGKVVLHEAIGLRDHERKLLIKKDTLFHMASNTKPVIATAILMLAEEGKLSLDDRVRKYLPAWDNYRSGEIRIRHLLSHTSGLRISKIFLEPVRPDTTLAKEAERFGKIGAEETPGTTYSYSNPGYNTLGAIIETISGQKLDVFLRERIYEPLGMTDSCNHETAAPAERMGVVYKKKDGEWTVFQRPGQVRYPIVRASGGMISTTRDYYRFCRMWLDGGSYEGRRLLSAESVHRAISPQTRDIYDAGEQWKRDSYYGYGWNVERSGAFQHRGSEGTFAWVDPKLDLIGIVLTQSGSEAGRVRRQFRALVEAAVEDDRER